MARNPSQFQLGLSLPAILEQYSTWAQCRAALFHVTHLPLTIWFLAIYLLAQRKNGLSALQLSRELSVSDNTAWKFKHKILQVMHERNQGETLTERIEIDDAYLGGERPGKRGCGAEHKVPFVAAVQTDDNGHPQRVQLRRVSGFTRVEIRRYAQVAIAPGRGWSVMAWGVSGPSLPRPTPMSASSPAVVVPARRSPPSTGSTPCWATSKTSSPAATMPSVANMYHTLPGRVRVPLQSALRPHGHDPVLSDGGGENTADAVPALEAG